MKDQHIHSIKITMFIAIVFLISNVISHAQWNMRVVVSSGQKAPGTNNAVFTNGYMFYVGFLTNGGAVLFPSTLEEGIGDGNGEAGVWIEKDGELELFYLTGKVMPNSGGSLFATEKLDFYCDQRSDKTILYGNYKSNGNDIENGFITTDDDWFLSSHKITGMRPYTGSEIDIYDIDGFCNGRLLLDCHLKEDNDDKRRFNDYFLAMYEPGLLAGVFDFIPIIKGGASMDGVAGQIYKDGLSSNNNPFSFGGGPDPNGQAAIFAVGNDADYMNDNVKDDNVYVTYKMDQDGNLSIIYKMNQGDEKSWLIKSTKFNSSGEMLFWGYPGVDDLSQIWSLWVGKDIDRVIATKGEQLMGASPDELLNEIIMWDLFDDGRGALFAGLSNDKKGIWMEDEDKFLRNVVLTGKPLPNSKIVTGFDVLPPYAINTNGTVAFRVWGRDNSNQDMQEIWAGDTDGLELVCRTGDKIETKTGDVKTIRSLVMPHHSGFEDYSVKPWYCSAMNNNDEILISVRFTDGTENLVVASGGLVVNSTDDDIDKNPGDGICECDGEEVDGKPKCTLRAALMEANANEGKDNISFNIPTDEDVHIIKPNSPLPEIDDQVSITGSMNDQQKPDIYLDGQNNDFDGLKINFDGEGSIIKNLIILHFDIGININESWNNTISSCYIGTDTDEGDAAGNRVGILIKDGNGNTIGGNSRNQGNYISCNEGSGILISGESSKNNTLQYNVIGPNAKMAINPGNGENGVLIEKGASKNLVRDNVISGNQGHGIYILGSNEQKTKENIIYANYIGADFEVSLELANELNGIMIENSGGNIIGGAPDGEGFSGNIISGNKGCGIEIKGLLSSINSIKANKIGVHDNETEAKPNLGDGIFINSAPRNTIGILQSKPGEGLGNQISLNKGSGVRIEGADATGNKIEGNLIEGNDYGVKIVDAPENTIGFESEGPNNVINLSEKDGIFISGAEAKITIVQYNYIGTDETGLYEVRNKGNGIQITGGASENSINYNLISGNKGNGIFINGDESETKSNFINDNKIGLKSDGISPLPNERNGIYIFESPANTISSVDDANFPGNIISGNKECGILIIGQKSLSNKIYNSYIGVSADGVQALPNGQDGIHLSNDVSEVEIGKPVEPGTIGGNLISGNIQNGIYIGASSNLNVINGNLIGTNRLGSVAIENSMDGIWIDDSPQNIIGQGTGFNLISGNGNNGISVFGHESSDNIFEGNRIGSNLSGKLAIANKEYGIKLFRTKMNIIDSNLISGNKLGIGVIECEDMNNIKQNIIGLDVSGEEIIGNGTGVQIYRSYNNRIGGSQTHEGNTISGNLSYGIEIKESSDNELKGNFIGTNIKGSGIDFGNQTGVKIWKGSKRNTIGSLSYDYGNILSGNKQSGIEIDGMTSDSNIIYGNKIGTDVSGKYIIPNVTGIKFSNCRNNQVGRTGADMNLITGNEYGIFIEISYDIKIIANLIGSKDNHNKRGNVIGIYVSGGTFTIGNAYSPPPNIILPNRIENNNIGIEIFGEERSISGQIISNEIFENTIGVKAAIHMLDSIYHYAYPMTISGNTIKNNGKGIQLDFFWGENIFLENNLFVGNWSNSSGIHLDSSAYAVIRGNQITSDSGCAIFLDNASDAEISDNNLFANIGGGVKNLNPSVTVMAQNNWWGDPSGPGGEGLGNGDNVSKNVEYSEWLTEAISLFVSTGADTIYVTPGKKDSTIAVFRNWENPEDIIDVSYSDELGWLEGKHNISIALNDSLGVGALIRYQVPEEITAGIGNEVTVEAVSGDIKSSDSFVLYVYSSILSELIVKPDTVRLSQNEAYQFVSYSYDQRGNEMQFVPTWEAFGGEIDNKGLYIAGTMPGTYEITAKDTKTGIQATAIAVIDTTAVSVEDDMPKYLLSKQRIIKVYPNPSSEEITFQFKLEKTSLFELTIYNSLGGKVKTLICTRLNEGNYNFAWDINDIINGIYYYKVKMDSGYENGNFLIIK